MFKPLHYALYLFVIIHLDYAQRTGGKIKKAATKPNLKKQTKSNNKRNMPIYTNAQKEKAVELLQMGMPCRRVAALVGQGCSSGTPIRWRQEFDLERKGSGNSATPLVQDRIKIESREPSVTPTKQQAVVIPLLSDDISHRSPDSSTKKCDSGFYGRRMSPRFAKISAEIAKMLEPRSTGQNYD